MERHGLLSSDSNQNLLGDEEVIVSDEESNDETDETDEDDEFDEKEDSYITGYLAKIQDSFVKGEKPEIYKQGTFWYPRKMPSFALSDTAKINPEVLYEPRVFIWLPHYLTTEHLKCPDCGSKLNADGYTKDPRARRITDLTE